jgi:hypothetical protein
VEHYFFEAKKKKKNKKNRKSQEKGFSMASYFDSKKYDKKVSGTLDLNLIGL